MTGTLGSRGTEDPLVRGPDTTLSAALADLDDGCCVLVTGDVDDEAYREAASRYFGTPRRERRRVLALANGVDAADAWLPDGVSAADDDAEVVRLESAVRDPAAASDVAPTDAATNGSGAVEAPDEPDRLDLDGDGGDTGEADGAAPGVRTALFDAIDAVAPDDGDGAGRLALRVGVYRVDMLCATIGSEPARAVLRDVAAETRERGGMAHFHLPRPAGPDPRSDPVVDEFAGALGDDLDVIVQLRSRDSSPVPEERWHILGWGTTEWNPLR
ncbi:DUF7504 family protein [Halobaculum sp. EA56]|uniref:DUF7504 family protein n=1 Tax=Halobaculum sp. EA56 TaxID=3421648 RepID=UPI003EBAE51C